ncbi:hypothetical protein BJX66DRAFT_332047 [Aspergillus keveii]|uniref:F-box domain-containing protein n=1 Tax=Aspergillus keveii TaxID=714993 RepID=A0ABR4GN77_9EURO
MVNQVSAGDDLSQNGLALDRRTPWHLSNSRSSASPQTPSSIVSVSQGMLYQLPPELLAEVISNLDTDLAQYLTVSREWQAAIERQTFAEIKLNTSERLAEFHEIVAKNRWRRTCLRRVEVIVQLEAYSVEARPRFETAEEHARNNTIFVHWVRAVLKSLALWSEQDRADVGLWLQAQSPSDLLDRQRLRAARMEPETDLYRRDSSILTSTSLRTIWKIWLRSMQSPFSL